MNANLAELTDAQREAIGRFVIEVIGLKMLRNGVNTPENVRSRTHIIDLKQQFGLIDDWLIRKVPGTKDDYYVAEGNPPTRVLRAYNINPTHGILG